jgi:hypothetical protein
VSLDKKAQNKPSLAGQIADGLNPFRSSKTASKKSYTQSRRSSKPTIEAKDTSSTRTTADANDPSKGTTP